MTAAHELPGPREAAELRQVWLRDNQRHLVLAAGHLAALLAARAEEARDRGRAAAVLAEQVRRRTGRPVAHEELVGLFALTRFEAGILLAAAAPELGLPAADGAVTFGRCLAALPDPHWSALVPDAALRRWRLLDVPARLPAAEAGGLQGVPLAVDERVLHALAGAETVDERLAGRARLVTDAGPLGDGQRPQIHELATLLTPAATDRTAGRATVLTGADQGSRREAAVPAAGLLGLSTLLVEAPDIPEDPPNAELFLRLLAREGALGGRAVLIEADDRGVARSVRLAQRLAGHGVPTILSVDDLGAETAAGPPAGWPTMHLTGSRGGGTARLTPALRGLAERRRPETRLADLFLTDAAQRSLQALLGHVRQREKVHGEWGYARRGRGLAVTALFTGPSGTGKTTAAEAVAGELGRDLLAVDLSQVVSKYLGETEKNLARLFAAAASAGAVLLFDEGDALFARRTQVRDSRDRYANLEVSYLLQRLDSFDGIAILTSNASETIDSAFTRRMRFAVSFPFPDPAARAQLWRGAFPRAVPTDGLDVARLAQLSVTGGTIAQLALHAAFLAADSGEPVRMSHLLAAARIECEKLERPLSPHEVKGWV